MLEVAMVMLLSQAVRHLVDPATDHHGRQVLKKALASELVSFHLSSLLCAALTASYPLPPSPLQRNFSQGLQLHFTRKGAPSPGGSLSTPALPPSSLSLESSLRARTSSLSQGEEHGLFRLADSFARHFAR